MRRQYFITLFFSMVVLLIVHSGCSTTKSVVSKVKKEKPYLKKKIMVLPPVDHTGLPSEKAVQISEALIELLKESPKLLFYAPPDGLSLPSVVKAPKFGVAYYNPDLAKMAKDHNMNAIIAAYLPPIEKTKGRAGIWPLRYTAEIFKVSMTVNVLDVTNGCLFLTEFDSEAVPLSLEEVKTLKENEALDQVLEKAIPAILEHQASAVMKRLEDESWTGRILDASADVLKINAGKDVGIRPDQLFAVYERGESIVCQTGRTVDPLEKKIGEIKAISVMDQYSLAAPEAGGPFLAGQTIMFNPN